jgi:crotonobetainyl-CoA:carnitine CoA-transferase CaiB-like acyl-CoA transferase
MANMPQLTAILDEVFGAQPMAHWYEVFNGVHVTFGAVRGPQEVINDPQLRANDIVVPLEGAGGKLTSTISSPIQVHGVAKVPREARPEDWRAQRGGSPAAGIHAKPKSTACARAAPFRKQIEVVASAQPAKLRRIRTRWHICGPRRNEWATR